MAIAEAELRNRDHPCDVRITDELVDLCRPGPAMLMEIHPDSAVYLALARKVAKIIGIPFTEPPTAMRPTAHALATVRPAYDAVAEHHGLLYRTTPLYSTLDEVLSRRQLIERSFALYDSIDRETLKAATGNRQIAF